MPERNSSSSSSSDTGGCGLTVVGVVFVVLKLTGHIDWSWVWVLSPWWISLALWVLKAVALLAFKIVVNLTTDHRRRERLRVARAGVKPRPRSAAYDQYTSLQDLKEAITEADHVRDEEER